MNEAIENRAGGIGGRDGAYLRRRYMIYSTRCCLPWWPFRRRESWDLTPLSLNYYWLPICLLRLATIWLDDPALGYGDIVSRTGVARGLAIVEGGSWRTAIPGGGCSLGQPLRARGKKPTSTTMSLIWCTTLQAGQRGSCLMILQASR